MPDPTVETTYGLSLEGLNQLPEAARALGDFIWGIQQMVEAHASVERHPTRPVTVEWRKSDAKAAHRHWSNSRLLRLQQILSSEFGLSTSSGGPSPDWDIEQRLDSDWHFTVRPDISRFRSIKTIDDYLEISRPVVAGDENDRSIGRAFGIGLGKYNRFLDHDGWSATKKTAAIVTSVIALFGAIGLIAKFIASSI